MPDVDPRWLANAVEYVRASEKWWCSKVEIVVAHEIVVEMHFPGLELPLSVATDNDDAEAHAAALRDALEEPAEEHNPIPTWCQKCANADNGAPRFADPCIPCRWENQTQRPSHYKPAEERRCGTCGWWGEGSEFSAGTENRGDRIEEYRSCKFVGMNTYRDGPPWPDCRGWLKRRGDETVC